jgi:hypothetical protein
MKAILNDLRALEQMLKDGLVESGIRRIGAEQEMFLVDSDLGPATDAGGGSLHDLNWLLERGYQVHCKDASSQRAGAWAATVEEWFDDPHNPDRQFGWVPSEVSDYVRPIRRLAVRLFKRNEQTAHALLISTLETSDVMALLGRPQHDIYEPELVIQAYTQFYDQRGGSIEIEFKEDKQGFGMTKRKRQAEAQQIVVFLTPWPITCWSGRARS